MEKVGEHRCPGLFSCPAASTPVQARSRMSGTRSESPVPSVRARGRRAGHQSAALPSKAKLMLRTASPLPDSAFAHLESPRPGFFATAALPPSPGVLSRLFQVSGRILRPPCPSAVPSAQALPLPGGSPASQSPKASARIARPVSRLFPNMTSAVPRFLPFSPSFTEPVRSPCFPFRSSAPRILPHSCASSVARRPFPPLPSLRLSPVVPGLLSPPRPGAFSSPPQTPRRKTRPGSFRPSAASCGAQKASRLKNK